MNAPPRQPQAEGGEQQQDEAVGEGQQVDAQGRGEHQDAEHPAPAVAVGPEFKEDPGLQRGSWRSRQGAAVPVPTSARIIIMRLNMLPLLAGYCLSPRVAVRAHRVIPSMPSCAAKAL